MSQETALSKAVAKLGETDKILVETSSLPEGVKERIANKISNMDDWVRQSAAVGFVNLVALTIATLAGLVSTARNPSAEVVREDWLSIGFVASIFLSILAVALAISLHYRRERSELRQLLIHGGGRETQQ